MPRSRRRPNQTIDEGEFAVKFEAKPVLDKDGTVQLYDIYVDGEWHGSRRTLAQCDLYLKFIISRR